MEIKVYVDVDVLFDNAGNMHPKSLTWEDGTVYPIDKVLDVRPAHAMRAGGQGDRYTIMIGGHGSYLFFERSAKVKGCSLGRWFVERRCIA